MAGADLFSAKHMELERLRFFSTSLHRADLVDRHRLDRQYVLLPISVSVMDVQRDGGHLYRLSSFAYNHGLFAKLLIDINPKQ